MSPSIARQFARFACSESLLPEPVIHAAYRAMLDTLGAMIAGGAHSATRRVAAAQPCHPGQATLTTGGSADAEAAAVINGMAAHVWDMDDTSYTGIMHGSAVLLPAILAMAQERGSRADEICRAFVVGSEIAYTLAELCTHAHYFHGWWSTVTFGLTGTVAAAGVLLALDEDQMTAALGMAAAASGGGKAVFGTDAKPLLVGQAARQAISLARMAKAGLTGPEQGFEDPRGYLALLNGDTVNRAALGTLGQRWRLVTPGLLFKTNPVCSAAHAAIDQMQGLMRRLEAEPTEITEIRAEVPELVDISLVYPDPQTPQQAQFSLPYAMACVARHGRVRFADLSPEALTDPETRRVMAKVTVTRAADLSTPEMRKKFPESARLTVKLTSGAEASGFCGSARGMPDNPQTDTELITKFEAACAYAGLCGPIEVRLGDNPATTLARLLA
ncbi:MAG: MmgE/PrpD family protein [Pseudomonadota bacterium]